MTNQDDEAAPDRAFHRPRTAGDRDAKSAATPTVVTDGGEPRDHHATCEGANGRTWDCHVVEALAALGSDVDAVAVTDERPSDPSAGMMWVDRDRRSIAIHDGRTFVPVVPGVPASPDGETLEGFESTDALSAFHGRVDAFEVDQSMSTEGAASLRCPGVPHEVAIWGQTLDVESGLTYRVDLRAETGSSPTWLYFCRGEDASTLRGYGVQFVTGNNPSLELRRFDAGLGPDHSDVSLAHRALPAPLSARADWVTLELSITFDGIHVVRLLSPRYGAVTVLLHDAWEDDVQYTTGCFGFGAAGRADTRWDDLRRTG